MNTYIQTYIFERIGTFKFGVQMLILEGVKFQWLDDECLSKCNPEACQDATYTTINGWFHNGQHPHAIKFASWFMS